MRLSLNLGLGSVATSGAGGGGGTSVTALMIAFFGDSFAEGSSGAGSIEGYGSLQPTVRRMGLATGTLYRTENKSLTGSSCTYARDQWLAREVFRRYNYICTGRNDGAMTAAQILAVYDEILADQRPGEIIILGSVHNFNNDTEANPSAGYTKWTTLNAGLAARANGTTIFYTDSRLEAVYEANLDWTQDMTRQSTGQPSKSLTVAGSDSLHLNTNGCEMQARGIISCVLAHRALTEPLTNLLTNPAFSGDTTTGWVAGGSATLTPSGGKVTVSGGGGFKGIAQDAIASGASGKKLFAVWDLLDVSTGGGNSITARLRQSSGGGTVYSSRDETYARNANDMFLAADVSGASVAFQLEAINNSALSFAVRNLGLYEAYPMTIVDYAPLNIVEPSFAYSPTIGAPSVGGTVTGNTGVWDGYPDPTITFKWLADGVDTGETNLSFTVGSGLLGKTLALEVTATSTAGSAVRTTTPVVVLPVQPLINDTFDSGITPWVAGTNNAVSNPSGRLRCQNNGSGWTKSFRNGAIPVKAGVGYRVTYDFIKTAHNGILRIGYAYDGEDVRLTRNATGTGFTSTFTPPGSNIYVSVACDTSSTTGFCDWDNIVIEKV